MKNRKRKPPSVAKTVSVPVEMYKALIPVMGPEENFSLFVRGLLREYFANKKKAA